MNLPLYVVDAFTDKQFAGNPAAVVPLETWLDDKTMQNIAAENNLSETAFFVKTGDRYRIRWFTPASEIDLCGHATLGSSFIIKNYLDKSAEKLFFDSRSGELIVEIQDDLISLNFPARKAEPVDPPAGFAELFPVKPSEILFNKTYLVVFENEKQIREMKFNINDLLNFKTHGTIITAKGDQVDFVSRFFAPDVGVPEDPVTGYAHTVLIPYWAERLKKNNLSALQVSKRGGELFCGNMGDRVKIGGKAALYSEGRLFLNL